MILDGLLVERSVDAEVDNSGDGLAPFLVRHAHDQRVTNGGMGLENLLDFLGVNFLASSVDADAATAQQGQAAIRSEEHTSELQSLMRISYAVFCLKKKK